MKKLFTILLLLLCFTIFAENKISIIAQSNGVIAEIQLNDSEYIILNDQFLFLFIESDNYDFIFTGYPDGISQENGDVYYSEKLILEGSLTLKDGIPPGEYSINVILGFQTCDKEGICNIPVEVSEEIIIKNSNNTPVIPVTALIILILSIIILSIIRKRRNS